MSAMNIALISVGATLVLAMAIFVFLVAPGRRNMKQLKTVKYAHRGLHGDGRVENSMSAFEAAVTAGFGIELDVRLSSDGVLVVFHDDTLERVVGIRKRVDELTAAELSALRLGDTNDGIPTFDEVLSMVDGRVPLLVEIKEDKGSSAVSDAAAAALSLYNGPFIVESFNPLSVRNARAKLPMIPCGFLSCRHKVRSPLYFMLTNLLLNFICRPDFIAYCDTDSSNFSLRFVRTFLRTPTLAWTVRSEEAESNAAKAGFDSVIFEGYSPSK